MNDKLMMRKKICELDFAIHELVLFLDTHPTNSKAMELLCEYRRRRDECVEAYEKCYGKLIVTTDDVEASRCWKWLDSPWPWEIDFMEA